MSINAFTSPSLINLSDLPTAPRGASFEDIMGTQSDPMLRAYAKPTFDWNSIPPVAPKFGDDALTTPKPPAGILGLDEAAKEVQPLKAKTYEWTDRANLVNASVTAMFTGLADLAGVWSSQKLYDLYQEQERLYIENANEQARRLQIRGEIALADLRSRHAVSEGTNELAVAGAGAGGYSGSFVDKLMANRKYDTRDEVAQDYETLWAVYNAKRDGYIKAYETAGQAYARAIQQRNTSISRLFTGLAAGVNALMKDKQAYDQTKAQIYNNKQALESEIQSKLKFYSNRDTGGLTTIERIIDATVSDPLSDSLSIGQTSAITNEDGNVIGHNYSLSAGIGADVKKETSTSSIYKLIQKETMPLMGGDL